MKSWLAEGVAQRSIFFRAGTFAQRKCWTHVGTFMAFLGSAGLLALPHDTDIAVHKFVFPTGGRIDMDRGRGKKRHDADHRRQVHLHFDPSAPVFDERCGHAKITAIKLFFGDM
ncbi:hypothetical protein G3N57_09410 [Paraburkholderia sp. Se-20369]|nr:hypothetical protein [Paraburkholderia sp. Se-20369]